VTIGRTAPSAVRLGLVGAAVTAALVAGYIMRAAQYGTVEGEPYVVGFPTEGALNVMLAQGDGQAFAQLATDPALRRPEAFAGQTEDTPVGVEATYRAQRPLLGYLAWLTSLGRADLVGPALVVWAIVGGGLAVGAVAALLASRSGPRPELALLMLVLPGALLATSWLGPELLGVGLLALAWRWWERWPAAAVAAFTLAALVRESMLVVPAALALWTIVVARDVRRALFLVVPAAVLAAWLVVVHARFGWWPSAANTGRLGPPLAGLADALPQLSVVDVAIVAVNAALVIVVVRYRRDPLAWAIAASLALALCAGWDVWLNRGSINRVLLPAQVFAGVLLATGVRPPGFGGEGIRGRIG
jgi:hypothetical protein